MRPNVDERDVHGARRSLHTSRGMHIHSDLIISTSFELVGETMPVNLHPGLVSGVVMGLLFGPFACLGYDAFSLIFNIRGGMLPEICWIV